MSAGSYSRSASRAHRGALAAVDALADHDRPRHALGHVGRRVGRAVVDDDHLRAERDLLGDAIEHGADRRCLVVRGDKDRDEGVVEAHQGAAR
jgi:hypothetical protein